MLAFFTKYYNNWCLSIDREFSWVDNAPNKINSKVLVRLMTHKGGVLLDVLLDKYGYWGPQHVFCTVNFDDIVKVENELVEM